MGCAVNARMYARMYVLAAAKAGERKAYLNSRLRENLVLLQDAVSVRFVGDLEEGDAFDGSHCLFLFFYCSVVLVLVLKVG